MKKTRLSFLGLPVFGVILPFFGFRQIPVNRDGSFVDTGEDDLLDEESNFYVEPLVFEWLGRGYPFPWIYKIRERL